MAVLYAKLIGVIVQHWILLEHYMERWPTQSTKGGYHRAGLDRFLIAESLDDLDRLRDLLCRLEAVIANKARVNRRNKHPSLFQLLENPELLDYIVA